MPVGSFDATLRKKNTTEMRITINWEDDGNANGIRPEAVDVIIYRRKKEYDTVTLTAMNGWTYVAELPLGFLVSYTVGEKVVPEGYTMESSGDWRTGYTITNKRIVEKQPVEEQIDDDPPSIDDTGDIKEKVIDYPPVTSTKIHIFLAGRNLTLLKEYLWALDQDMSESLHEYGMTYFTRDSIVDIAERKRKLETFLNIFDTGDWTYPKGDGNGKTYVFTISPSGEQTNMIDFVFHCAGPNIQADIDPASADAIWLLADGLIYKDESCFDSYTKYLQGIIEGLPKSGEGVSKPACLIMSQIEEVGHFSSITGKTELPKNVRQKIQETAEKCFGTYCKERIPVALIPVQVYGGLECAGMDEKGDPILRLCDSGYFQEYITENCQTPGFYTLQQICTLWQTDFFVNRLPDTDGLMTSIRRHYGKKFGNLKWTPYFLNGDKAL